MKKEAPEQTTLLGHNEYCPCYTYVDGDGDPDCPFHGRKGQSAPINRQKPLSLILSEIEERAKANTSTRAWPLSDVPKLVKALRRAMQCIDMSSGETWIEKARADISDILNQK